MFKPIRTLYGSEDLEVVSRNDVIGLYSSRGAFTAHFLLDEERARQIAAQLTAAADEIKRVREARRLSPADSGPSLDDAA
jgi:hypothetical protein